MKIADSILLFFLAKVFNAATSSPTQLENKFVKNGAHPSVAREFKFEKLELYSRPKYNAEDGQQDQIDALPDLPEGLQSATFGGFVEVNPQYDSKLFYLAFESFDPNTQKPKNYRFKEAKGEVPLLIWLNGGPGASSSVGNFLENGPYILDAKTGKLKVNPYSWNTQAHISYWDQPVGTGYSHFNESKGKEGGGYVKDYEMLSKQFAVGVLHFLDKHPQFRKAPLYMTGESFAGIYIPWITKALYDQNKMIKDPERKINIQGALIGNPGNFRWQQYESQINFFYSHGLINQLEKLHSEQMWEEVKQLMNEPPQVGLAFDKAEKMSDYLEKRAGSPFIYDIRSWEDLFTDVYSPALAKYLDRSDVKEAMNVPKSTPWLNGDGTSVPNPVINNLRDHLMGDHSPTLNYILNKANLRISVFDGVMDGSSCNSVGVFEALLSLQYKNFNLAQKQLWTNGKDKFGYYQKVSHLTFIWVSNSGHLVPIDQPQASLDLLNKFLEKTF